MFFFKEVWYKLRIAIKTREHRDKLWLTSNIRARKLLKAYKTFTMVFT